MTQSTDAVAPLPRPADGALTRWVHPADRADYDRRPLTDDERAALRAVCTPKRGGRWPRRTVARLARLIEPMRTVLWTHPTTTVDARAHAIARIVRAMGRTGTAYWQWGDADWIATAGHHPGRDQVYTVAYVLGGSAAWLMSDAAIQATPLARSVFGRGTFEALRDRIRGAMRQIGYSTRRCDSSGPRSALAALPHALLLARSPHLEALTLSHLVAARAHARPTRVAHGYVGLSHCLAALGLLREPLPPRLNASAVVRAALAAGDVPEPWRTWLKRWYATSTLTQGCRAHYRTYLYETGRWLARERPHETDPTQWTAETAAAFCAMVDRAHVGEWTSSHAQGLGASSTRYRGGPAPAVIGKPLQARSKDGFVRSIRTFFYDVKRWKWADLADLEPLQDLRTPVSIRRLLGPNPRDVLEHIWLKLVSASLNLTDDDLGWVGARPGRRGWYPLTLVRAVAVVWTHAGLRSDEIRRLRVGCAREIPGGGEPPGAGPHEAIDAELAEHACFLHVPINKTDTEYAKPVGKVIWRLIHAWEAARPPQPPALDPKTGERVHYLFSLRGKPLGQSFINDTLIPMLCRKANVPIEDVPGKRITSHRGRASAASWYFNTHEGMTLEELMRWLGHARLTSTQSYVRASPLKQARAFVRAHKNSYYMEVLVDPRSSGPAVDDMISADASAADAGSRIFYPLGNGDHCANPFYARCPHRVVCPGCAYHVPAEGQLGQALRAKGVYLRMLMEVPLSDDERAAAEGDAAKQTALVAKLQHTPTPSGPTPVELDVQRRRALPVLQPGPSPAEVTEALGERPHDRSSDRCVADPARLNQVSTYSELPN